MRYTLETAELINGINAFMARANIYSREDVSDALENTRELLRNAEYDHDRDFLQAVITFLEMCSIDR